jgi:branched-chain amino acid transport system permease protein
MDFVQILAQQAFLPRALNALIQGIGLGAIYALLAVGFVIIFKATQVLNFAHGGFAAGGAMLTVYFATIADIPGRWLPASLWGANVLAWVLAVILAVILTAGLGLLAERLFIEPMIGEPLFSVAILTLGLDFVLRTVVNDYISIDFRSVGDPWGLSGWSPEIGGSVVPIGFVQIATIVTVILALGLLALFFRSKIGVAMRATAFDQEAAMVQGIPVNRIFAIAWIIGAGLAAVAGVFASVPPRAFGVSAATGIIAFRAFPAIIIGGLDSVAGAAIGAMIVGVAEVSAGVFLTGPTWSWLGSGFAGIVPYVIMTLVLFVKPYGLFGTEEIRRV